LNYYSIALFILLFVSCNSLNKKSDNINDLPVQANDTILEKTYHTLPDLPDSISFAGENILLKGNEDLQDRLYNELVIQINFHSKTILMLRELGKWRSILETLLEENGVHKDFVFLAMAESGLDNEATSPKGAAGMWQIMTQTAKEKGLVVDKYVDQRRDPFLATKAACDYLKQSRQTLGSWINAVAAYNRGLNGIKRELDAQNVNSFLDVYTYKETSRYLFRILAMKIVFNAPEEFGFVLKGDQLKKSFEFSEKTLAPGEYNAIELAEKFGLNYRTLKLYNPWIRDSRSYRLVLNKEVKIRFP